MAKNKKQETKIPETAIFPTFGSNAVAPEDYIATVSIGSNDPTIPYRNSLIGKQVSINLKKETFFGVGNIWLSPENYWATVPGDLTDAQYNLLYTSLQKGILQLGKVFIPPIDKVSNTKEKYWAVLEKNGFESKNAKSAFQTLIRKGSDEGWTAIEIAQFCLSKEEAGKKRKEVVRLLSQLIKNYDGPIQLYDPPDNDEGIKKVTIKPGGIIEAETNSGKKVAKPLTSAAPPKGHVPGNKSPEQAMDDLLQ